MPQNIIYHNPRCSKSRQTLRILQDRRVEVEVIEYLGTPPSKAELEIICTKLGIEPTGLIRSKEKLFLELGLSLDDKRSREEWLEILVQNPKLIERPIVIYNGKAIIGRPPERVHEIL